MRSDLPELARNLGIAERTLRRAIVRGTVHAHRPAPRTLDLPAHERAYLRTHWPLVQRLTAALRTEPDLRLAVLFGSVARGEETAAYDLDVLVAWRRPDLVRSSRLRRRLAQVAERPIQFVTLDEARDSAELMADVVEDGRVLVDRERAWRQWQARADELRAAAVREAGASERAAHDVFAAFADAPDA
jgi:predicted nucleotidyltransferase